MTENEIINSLVTCLETSNKLLNTYHQEQVRGMKADLIQKMIETNALATSSALEYYGELNEVMQSIEEFEKDNAPFFVCIEFDDHQHAIDLLEEVRDAHAADRNEYKSLSEAILLLKQKQ